jgi:hypothetical protein
MSIKKGSLSDYFTGFGVKRLSAVEINKKVSHQHEFQGVKAFRDLFGAKSKKFPAKTLYFSEIEDEIIEEETTLTWYDARENQPDRSPEYRLYYKESAVTQMGAEKDLLFVGKKHDGSVVVIITVEKSTFENQILWLFDIDRSVIGDKFTVRKVEKTGRLGYVSKLILDKIGIEIEESDDTRLSKIESKYGSTFPRTSEFSEFARSFRLDFDIINNPDEALITWLNEEELLFRMLEKIIVAKKLEKGFTNVDDFIEFSLSVQNRRKSRAGYALENHLKFVFDQAKIRYDNNKITENKSRPDFIFPSIKDYHDGNFPVINLTMLGVKTTCKDRWRQVLSEADKIDKKHLFTLEPGISENQTAEMVERALQLVVPASVFSTFSGKQQKWLMCLKEFMTFVKAKQ